MQVRRLFHPQGPDRVAVISAEPSHQQPDWRLVRLARGPKATSLTGGGVFGPFPAAEAQERIEQLAEELLAEGFLESGAAELLVGLDSTDARTRARAALKAGWRRYADAAPKLIAMLETSVDDLCSVIDALGAMGDSRANLPLRNLAKRKLLSRRRSAVEALRNLEDPIGLAETHARALSELPAPLAEAVNHHHQNHQPILDALEQVESKRLGLYLDILYEIATPATVEAVRHRLATLTFAQPYVWRYVKSIFKRSMLRHDFRTFGWLAHQIELQALQPFVVRAKVKSGYDGVNRDVRIFSRRTAAHVRRSAWRYLRRLAQHRPDLYAFAAAEAVAAYHPSDASPPVGLQGQFGHCYLLQQILFAGGKRLTLNYNRLVFHFRSAEHISVPAGVREEAYPHLWDEHSEAYLHILARSDLHLALRFAENAIRARHPNLIASADTAILVQMMSSSQVGVVEMARVELEKRFDPNRPDWNSIDELLNSASPTSVAAALGREWMAATAAHWVKDQQRAIRYLTSEDAETMTAAMAAMASVLADDPTLRRGVAEWVAEWLRAPHEPMEGIAHVARTAVLHELAERVSLDEALRWVQSQHPAIQSVGAELMAADSQAARSLGIETVGQLADHELFAVRNAAHQMLVSLVEDAAQTPDSEQALSVLFNLVDARWEDTRAQAVRLLRSAKDWSHAKPEELIGFVDSLRGDVQEFAMDLIRSHAATLDMPGLLGRVVEHPHQGMRHFALELAEKHLVSGVEGLKKLLPCIRATLLDPWPRKAPKEQALRLLAMRSRQDAEQAAMALKFLGEWVQVQGVGDFELALSTMTEIQMAHPEIPSSLSLKLETQG